MPDVSAAELAHASEVLVHSALRLREHQRFVVVADAETASIGEALAQAATKAGAVVTAARLDQLKSVSTGHTGDRPHKVLPDLVRRAMLAAQASAFVASAPHQELSMREQLLHIVGACGVRHAHMPGITPRAFAAGMRRDYDQVAAWGRALFRRLEFAQHVHTSSAAGTDLELTFGPDPRWVPRLGTLAAGKWVNFPAGAIYASPVTANGVLVVNASLGEFFGAREGLLLHKPVALTFDDGRVVKVEAPLSPELESDIGQMLAFAPNSDRVGLVAIGVNDGIELATGEAVVDQNLPGLHLFLGDPSGRATGVRWSARTSFAACQAGSSVTVDGLLTIDQGRLAFA
ncbi:MAG: aminopeptidase [Polyangiaceae bacterium]|jgi:aminopeptidase